MVEPKIDRRRLERPYQEDRGSYLPTADEIALACRVIQSGWTQTEETKRMGAYAPMPVEFRARFVR